MFLFGDRTSNKNTVFGAFIKTKWNKHDPTDPIQGDGESCIFTVYPEFRMLPPFRGEGEANYAYFNDKFYGKMSKYREGLGFGGNDDFSKFRIWIDKDLLTGSYAGYEGKTYEIG